MLVIVLHESRLTPLRATEWKQPGRRRQHPHYNTIGRPRYELPEAVAGEVVKRIFDGGLVIALADRVEVALEGFGHVRAEGEFVPRDEAAIEEVEDGEQKGGLVRPLIRAALVAPEVLEAIQPLLPCLFRRHRGAEQVQVYGTSAASSMCIRRLAKARTSSTRVGSG